MFVVAISGTLLYPKVEVDALAGVQGVKHLVKFSGQGRIGTGGPVAR